MSSWKSLRSKEPGAGAGGVMWGPKCERGRGKESLGSGVVRVRLGARPESGVESPGHGAAEAVVGADGAGGRRNRRKRNQSCCCCFHARASEEEEEEEEELLFREELWSRSQAMASTW